MNNIHLKTKSRSRRERMHRSPDPYVKRICTEKDYDIDLILLIHGAEGIDNPTVYPSTIGSRMYRVVFWVHPELAYRTKDAEGMLNPYLGEKHNPDWRELHVLELDKSKDCRFLYVEVFKCGSEADPGTSSGMTLVGRARIPLPKLSSRKGGRYGLVRLDGAAGCLAEGHIFLTMEMKKMVID